ncbi:C40 family peptidase [Pseudomonas oligotrophica]|uniref:C40 family peptidase n=1 Tax=Pseudomonas oligotrophica TaxID=2912055 RepID=UPI001F38389A|nr:C40 family peptidase [Pseudomonas oligotrophica]MCF7202157.1 C40 family peptidase [Pseudomonas oligotrophica]
MPLPARLSLILLTLLLTACAGRTPLPEPTGAPFEPADAAYANDVLFRALGLVGTPYRYGGNTPDSGFDCSGLIGYVYRDAAGLALPRTTTQMSQLRAATIGREALQAGDLVFFATAGGRRVSHAGIYVGDDRFVHAPSSGGTVRLDSLNSRYWTRAYLGAKRVLEGAALARNP